MFGLLKRLLNYTQVLWLRAYCVVSREQVILKKAGYMLNVASAVIVFFAALRIFDYDVTAYVVTWVSTDCRTNCRRLPV